VGLLPLLYGVPFLPSWAKGKLSWYRVKDIPGIKAAIVAGVITYAVVAVPLAYAGARFDLKTFLTTSFILVFTGTNSHLFDVRDLVSDRQQGVPTLTVLIGLHGTRWLWTGLNLMLLILLGWAWFSRIPSPPIGVVIPTTILNLIAIWGLTPETPRSVYSIGLDGSLILPGLFTYLGTLL